MLEPEQVAAFEAHLARCPECQRDIEELGSVPAFIEQAAPAVDVPPGLRERTFAAIEQAAPPRRRTVELRKVGAAAAVLLVGFGTAVVRETGRPAPAAAQVVELTAPAGGTARAVPATKTGRVIEMEVDGLAPAPAGLVLRVLAGGRRGRQRRTAEPRLGGNVTVDGEGPGHGAVGLHRRRGQVGITVEPDDGNPVHTTQRVLAGARPPTHLR